MKLKQWVIFAVVFFSASTLFGMGGKPEMSRDVFYVLYIKKKIVPDVPLVSKPGFSTKRIGNYYLLGKMRFDEQLKISYDFFEFREPILKKEIDSIVEAIVEFNARDKSKYLSTKSGREEYIEDIFYGWNLEYFVDREIGKKYFDSKQKEITQEELKDVRLGGGFVYK